MVIEEENIVKFFEILARNSRIPWEIHLASECAAQVFNSSPCPQDDDATEWEGNGFSGPESANTLGMVSWLKVLTLLWFNKLPPISWAVATACAHTISSP